MKSEQVFISYKELKEIDSLFLEYNLPEGKGIKTEILKLIRLAKIEERKRVLEELENE